MQKYTKLSRIEPENFIFLEKSDLILKTEPFL